MFTVKAVRNFVGAERNKIFNKIAKEIRKVITISQTKKISESFEASCTSFPNVFVDRNELTETFGCVWRPSCFL